MLFDNIYSLIDQCCCAKAKGSICLIYNNCCVTMMESLGIEKPRKAALVSQGKTWTKFRLPGLRFLICLWGASRVRIEISQR